MGRVWDDDLISLRVTTGQVIGANEKKSRVFPVRTGCRLQGETIHTCNDLQFFLQGIHHFEGPLHRSLRCERMDIREAWKRCCHFVHRRIVLHRAGAKGIETMIHTEGLLLQLPIVTVKLHFIELWQIERLLAERNVSGTGRHVRSREQIHPVSFFRAFKNQFHVIHLLSEGKQGCRSPHGCSSPSRTRGSRRLQQARLGCRVRRASARPPPDRSGS